MIIKGCLIDMCLKRKIRERNDEDIILSKPVLIAIAHARFNYHYPEFPNAIPSWTFCEKSRAMASLAFPWPVSLLCSFTCAGLPNTLIPDSL